MLDTTPEDITDGAIVPTLLALAAPLVAQNFAFIAQQVVDTFWVGRLGETAVAAIGLTIPITALIAIPFHAIFTGSQIVTSQYVGSDDRRAASHVPVHAAALSLVSALVLLAVMSQLSRPVVELFDSGPDLTRQASTYLFGWAVAYVFTSLSDSLESGFVGWGNSKAALYVNLTAIGVNVVVDPFLIFGWWLFPEWGLFGAAMATGVGYAVGGLLALGLAYRGSHGYRLPLDSFEVDPSKFVEVVRVGAPVSVRDAGRHLARLGMIALVTVYGGAAALAAYTLGARVSTVAYVPAMGLGQATTSMVGQNVGADQPGRADRAVRVGVVVGTLVISLFGVVQWFAPAPIVRLFVPDISLAAFEHTITYLKILALGYWSFAIIYVVQGGFNGASRTDVGMYAILLQYWGVRLPFAAVGVVVLGHGVTTVFWAVTVSNVVAAVGLIAYYYWSVSTGTWHATTPTAAD